VVEAPIRILLIEDEPDLRETLADLLEERGYEIETVSSSVAAVELAKTRSFDVVITDIRTEGHFDGLSALEKVKETQPDVSGVVITGYSTEDYALRACKLQVEDYLKKPFQLSTFIQRIESIASQKRKSKQEARQQGKLRQTIGWFAEQVAHSASSQGGLSARVFLEKVELLSGKLGLGAELCQELRIAAALTFAEETMALELPDFISETLPPSALSSMHHRYEKWTGQGEPEGLVGEEIPLGSRILKLALALAGKAENKAAKLAEASPGDFDPHLIELHDSERAAPAAPMGDARSVLAVGLALEDAGEFEQALETFRVLAREYPGTRAAVFGTLGLARLHRVRGDLQAAGQAAQQSFLLAKRQGPSLAAACGLQAGILLSQQNDPAGQPVLAETARRLNDVRDVGGRAVCVLAQAHFWGLPGPVDAAARTLVSSEFTPDFLASASWLTRYCLRTLDLDEGLRTILLSRYALESPNFLVEACGDTQLEGPARVRAISALSEHLPSTRLDPLLRSLLGDDSPQIREAARAALGHSSSSQPKLGTLRLFCFGEFRVYRGEERLDMDWRRVKPKYFLAYLTSLGARSHSDDSLLEVFWPGDPEKGRASLRAALSYLRRQFQPADVEQEINYFLKPPGHVQLNPDLPIWYDLAELERSVSRMRALNSDGQVEKAVATARYIAKLYEGPFLESCYMDWAVEIRDRTDMAVVDAFVLLSEWCFGAKRYDEAIEFGQRLIGIDPTLESAHENLMRTFLAQGKQAEALRQFERCEQILRQELDVEPGEELLELKEQALSQA
jgi:two-component SAPR family response regulator